MEVIQSIFTGLVLGYAWMTVIAVKGQIIDNRTMTPKEFWGWVAAFVVIVVGTKYLL